MVQTGFIVNLKKRFVFFYEKLFYFEKLLKIVEADSTFWKLLPRTSVYIQENYFWDWFGDPFFSIYVKAFSLTKYHVTGKVMTSFFVNFDFMLYSLVKHV